MPKLSEILGEHFNQIPEDLQEKYKDIDLVDSSNYVEKTELEAANNSIKEYKKQIKDRENQINKLKDEYKDVDGLKDRLTQLEEENEKQKREYEQQLNDIEFNKVLDKALDGYDVKDKEIVIKLLDTDKLKIDGKDVIGLKEQMEVIEKNRSYLFNVEEIGGTGVIGAGTSSLGGLKGGGKNVSIGELLGKNEADRTKQDEILNNFFN